MSDDPSNGYEALATRFMEGRGRADIGVAIVREWASSLRPGAAILVLVGEHRDEGDNHYYDAHKP